jgi:uncharacterized membrane protein YbhN (UPF0104 family)
MPSSTPSPLNPTPPVSTPGRHGRWRLAWRLLAAGLLLGGLVWFAGPSAVGHTLRQADPAWLLAGLGCALASNLAAVWRWGQLVRWLGHAIPMRPLRLIYFRSMAVTALLPGAMVGGDVYRAWALHRAGCPLASAGISVAVDRISGLWMLYALGAAGLLAGTTSPRMAALRSLAGVPDAWPLASIAAALLAGLLLVPLVALIAWNAWRRQPWGARHRSSPAQPDRWRLLQGPGMAQQVGTQATGALVAQLLSVGALACAALAFGVDLPWWLMAVTAVPVFLMAALPVSFGGWGTREAAAVACWGAFGVAAPAAISASVVFGLYALVLAGLGMTRHGEVAPPEPAA